MKGLSDKEIEILLVLLKDISADYNSNNITKKVKISPAGAFKAMKNLERRKLIKGKRMGKAVFYKVNLKDYYTFRTMETLLINEAREKASRWIFEFRDLYEHIKIAIIFGSIVRYPKKARDIDIVLVFKKEKNKVINKIIEERRFISTKLIHVVKQLPEDIERNLKNNDKVLLSALYSGYVLHGYDALLEVLKNVSSV